MSATEPRRRIVADTGVLVAFLIGQEQQRREVEDLLSRTQQIFAPAFWQAEFLSVLWKLLRAGHLERSDAEIALEKALHLPIKRGSVLGLWKDALALAVEADHSPYDTLFVALAQRLGTVVVTYDDALLKKFPTDTRRPTEV